MSRLLLGALTILLLLPLASAQTPGADSSLSFVDLPDEVESESSTQLINFDVRLETTSLVCVTQAGSFPVTLSATVTEANTTGNSTITASFTEDVLTFTVSSQESLQEYSANHPATLVVSAPGTINTREVTVNVTAMLPPGSGGCTASLPAAEFTQSVRIKFGRDPDLVPESDDEPMPGPAFGILLAAIGLALLLRRK